MIIDLYGLKDNWDPIEIDNEIPILWHIPKSKFTDCDIAYYIEQSYSAIVYAL